MTTNVEPVKALNLDLAQQQSFVRYFRKLPEKPPSTVRIFNRSDFYTVHDEDATFAAQYLSGNHIVKYMGEEPKLSYVVLNRFNFDKLVRTLLLVKQYRVEVYTKPTGSKNNDWLLEYKGSPGNLSQFEEILFETNELIFNSVVMALKLVRNTTVAVGCVNSTEGQFYVSEFNDNELFTELEAFIAQTGPKECIMPQGETAELNTIKSMFDRSGILVSRIKKTEFTNESVNQDLNRLLYFQAGQQRDANVLSECSLGEAMGCLQAAIKYLFLLSDEQNFNQFKLSTFDLHQSVRIDGAAASALNLLPIYTASMNKGIKHATLYGVLDKCCTAQGRRMLDQWLKQPLKDLNLINERLEIVEILMKNSEVRHTLCTSNLARVPDFLLLAKKMSSKRASLQDCYRVYQIVTNIPSLINKLRNLNNKCVKAMLIDPLCDYLADMEKYQSMIEQTIDLDLVDRGEYLIKSSFDDDLQELHEQKQGLEEKMEKVLRHAADDLGLDAGKSIKLECNDQHGYFLRVTIKDEKILRDNKRYKIIDAIKGGVRFTSDKLSEINSEYSQINENYQEQQKTVVKEIFEVAAGYADTLRNLNLCIAKVDVLVSFANVAAGAPIAYVRPKLHERGSGILSLKKMRHPCFEMQEGTIFIPNDVEFNREDKLLHLITGPNMGGKSTFIRSIGVIVAMAHVGSFVPCQEAEISVVDSILARVGANDSFQKGLSTFMVEMVETASIIKTATPNSLVIIDELGRGTSTYEGCGIATAIAEYLAKEAKCFSLFATHFHDITKLADSLPNVNNLHVTAVTTEKTITPLYQVREGPCDRSYGIHCARMVDFPQDVIDKANEYLNKLEHYDGMKLIKNYETGLKHQVIEEGDALCKEVLEEVKTWDLNKLSNEELTERLEKIKTELKAKNNALVNALLDPETSC